MTVCLVMIVRDEANVIERCLDSAKHLIDRYHIVDTGSTDDTGNVIKQWGEMNNIPGDVVERPWHGFGPNRTEMVQLAQAKADHLLILDADWTIQADAFELGTADQYMVRIDNNGFDHWLPIVLKDGVNFRFEGLVHEHMLADRPVTSERLEGPVVRIHSTKAGDRWPRDRVILEDQISRDLLYLAQTRRCLGHTKEAIALYEARAECGGFAEEVYEALLQAGVLKVGDGDWLGGLDTLIKAHEHRPSRGEALYEIIHGLRARGCDRSAWAFASTTRCLVRPNDVLFVWPWVYEWGLLFEYSILASRTGNHGDAAEAIQALLRRDLPTDVRDQAVANIRFLPTHLRESLWVSTHASKVGDL